jgi:hypothetical protein
VNISKMLECDTTEYTYHVQGMQNAFLIQFKFLLTTNTLVQLK